MGCVHMHWKISIIEGWVVQVVFKVLWKKTGEVNQKVKKIGQIINQTFALGLEHDKIWA